MAGPIDPREYGEGYETDEALAADHWATGLDVWGPVSKAYENFAGDLARANAQLWSLREAVRAEYAAELAGGAA